MILYRVVKYERLESMRVLTGLAVGLDPSKGRACLQRAYLVADVKRRG